MSEHTKERWMVSDNATRPELFDVVALVGERFERTVVTGIPNVADAYRIAISRNALAGIPDPAALRAQRDELLAACEAVAALKDDEAETRREYPTGTAGFEDAWRDFAKRERQAWAQLRAAIANAKGGA